LHKCTKYDIFCAEDALTTNTLSAKKKITEEEASYDDGTTRIQANFN